jgi:phosphoribosylformylglycinamidine (FGAM) synthase-like amidotransferase family enzyme
MLNLIQHLTQKTLDPEIDSIAGICDKTGRMMGMMPHPEAYLHRTHHPRWTREELPEEGMGLAFFRNAVQYIRDHLL